MGNGQSTLDPATIEDMKIMSKFSDNELRKLHRRFRLLDKDGSGTLTPDEFLSIPDLALNPLLERVLHIFDQDQDEQIQFEEFIQTLSTLSDKGSKEAKLKFVFSVYDMDKDGFISNGELFQVLKMMVGSNLTDQQLQQIVDKTIMEGDKDKDQRISFVEFLNMIGNSDIIDEKLTITWD